MKIKISLQKHYKTMKIKTISFLAAATLASYACKKTSKRVQEALINSRVINSGLSYASFLGEDYAPKLTGNNIKIYVSDDFFSRSITTKIANQEVKQVMSQKFLEDVVNAYKQPGINIEFTNVMDDPANTIELRFVANENIV